MRVAILNESKQSIGGGWSFIRNLQHGFENRVDLVPPQEADVVLIPSPSMVERDTVTKLSQQGKKIVLRLDNIPRNSRNRGTGTPRLYDLAQIADKIVYQSQWSREYLMPFIHKDGVVIHNGVDKSIFNPDGQAIKFPGTPAYLYSRFNRDETKGWERAWYKYQMIQRKNPEAYLVIVGNFSDELRDNNFDFYMRERFVYLGIVDDPFQMAAIYRGCRYLLATYYNDCYSNTYQEFLACGGQFYEPDLSGGTPELIRNGVISIQNMASRYLEVFDELL